MKSVTIPLVGGYTAPLSGGITDGDQFFENVFFNVYKNPVTGSSTVWAERRPEFETFSTPSSGNKANDLVYDPTMGLVSAFSANLTATTDSTVYVGTTSVGVTEDCVRKLTPIKLGSTAYVMISTYGASSWYLASDSYSNLTYTADGNNSTTLTDVKISGVNSVAGLYVGQKLSAASNIASGSRIVSIDATTFTVVLDTATTGGVFNDLSITKEPIAKIIDSDMPTDIVSRFVELDGYVLFLTSSGRIYNMNLNSVSAISANDYITCNRSGDAGVALERVGDTIVSFGSDSMEVFRNGGNPSGSILSRIDGATYDIGAFSQESVTKLNGTLYFLSRNRSGSSSVYSYSGGAPTQISDAGVEKTFIYAAVTNNRFAASSFNYMGSGYICFANYDPVSVVLPVTITQCYSAVTGLWVSINSASDFCYVTSDSSTTSGNAIYAASVGSGIIYKLNPSNYSAEVGISAVKIDLGTDNLKTIKCISLLGTDIATGTTSLSIFQGNYSSGTLIGTFDMSKENPRIYRCGSYRGGFSVNLTATYAGRFKCKAIKIDYEEGRH